MIKKRFLYILLAGAFVPAIAFAYTSPGQPTGFVSDFAHVLQASDIQALNGKLQALQDSTGDQIAVVTVPSLGGDTVENYAVKLFQEWGIGQKAHDNGILILVSVGDHEARIEVGYGLEGTVTDLQSGNIMRKVMIPAFQNDDYAGGITGAVDAISSIITASPDAAQYSEPATSNPVGTMNVNWVGVFFFIVIVFNVLARILGRTKSWWLGGVLGAIVGAVVGFVWGFVPIGIVAIVILTILGLIFDYIVSKHPPGPGGRGGFWPIFFMGGRGGGGSSGGGGFGGFGGGMSGGGGASGRW